MAGLTLKNIHKTYPNGVHAVNGVDLEIADQERVVFVGPDGCGKSTILRMIAGLEDISSGDIYIDGQRMNEVAAKDRDISMVFQNHVLYGHMSVYENMAFGLKLSKVPQEEIDSKVRNAARILGMESMLDCDPEQLSDELRQRVAMGRALVRSAKVILMDEPLSDLEDGLRAKLREDIVELQGRLGCTIVYVTNDWEEAMALGTRIVVMQDGVIQQAGTAKVLYNEPANTFVAEYTGSEPMNMIPARLDMQGEDVVADVEGQTFVLPADKAVAAIRGGFVGKEVILGIRSEDIFISNESEFAWNLPKLHLFDADTQMAICH